MGDSSAGGPLGGYLWQLRRALLELLRLNSDERITIEKHDDICVVRAKAELLTAIQAKHSLSDGTLTLRSVELWKTLRVWAKLLQSGSRPRGFVLATTSELANELTTLEGTTDSTGTVLAALVSALDDVAAARPNQELKTAYEAWEALTADQQMELLGNTRVVAGASRLAAISDDLRSEVRKHHIPQQDVGQVARELEGWFIQVVSTRLTPTGCEVSHNEVWEHLDEVHSRYLSVAAPPEPGDPATVQGLKESLLDTGAVFLRQLALLEAPESSLETAAHYFARARVARDRWLEYAAITQPQLNSYSSELVDHWRTESARNWRALPSDPTGRIDAGWRTYDGCMGHQAPFGATTAPTYLTVGSYHMMANGPEVGWHPDFLILLEEDDGE